MENVNIHESASVSKDAQIGENSKIWHQCQIRENAIIGNDCNLGKNVYIDHDVKVGNKVKIQNNCSLYYGVKIDNDVFIGPHVCFTNDKIPRAITEEGKVKKSEDWSQGETIVKDSASIGAGSIILPGVTIGKYAMVGAGSVVTKDVPDYGLVYGNPAKIEGYVDNVGNKVKK